jgi:hypothetical protein
MDWAKIPAWLLATALLLFVVLMLVPVINPTYALHWNGQPFGLVHTPGWELTEEVRLIGDPSKDSVAELPIAADEGFCFLVGVSGPLPNSYQRVHVWSNGERWYLQSIGGNNESKAACVKFKTKLEKPFKTGVTGPPN